MELALKHVERTRSERWPHRRGVPKAVANVITKRAFNKKLGDTEKEALAAYPRFHAEMERKIAKALQQITAPDRPDRARAPPLSLPAPRA